MTEWKELRLLIKPPIPKVPAQLTPSAASAPPSTTQPLPPPFPVKLNPPPIGIGRLKYLLLFILGAGAAILSAYIIGGIIGVEGGDKKLAMDLGGLLGVAFVIYSIPLTASRLRNMGYDTWLSSLMILPLFSLLLFLFCVSCPPRASFDK
jgi:hypothetical protein